MKPKLSRVADLRLLRRLWRRLLVAKRNRQVRFDFFTDTYIYGHWIAKVHQGWKTFQREKSSDKDEFPA